MEVYFDNCTLQRPCDDQANRRVRLEAEAVLALLEIIESGGIELVSSVLNELEISRCPDADRAAFGVKILELSRRNLILRESHRAFARKVKIHGLKPVDALHLAVAEEADIPYLCTCDDRFIKAAKRIPELRCHVISPIDLLQIIEP